MCLGLIILCGLQGTIKVIDKVTLKVLHTVIREPFHGTVKVVKCLLKVTDSVSKPCTRLIYSLSEFYQVNYGGLRLSFNLSLMIDHHNIRFMVHVQSVKEKLVLSLITCYMY